MVSLMGCVDQQLEIVPIKSISCTVIEEPTESIKDTIETRNRINRFYPVWACECNPELAEEKGIKCN